MGASLTDLELVQRIQSGDKKSFDILVLKYQHKVIGLITRYVHDPDTAMDVAQEAFIKAYLLKNFAVRECVLYVVIPYCHYKCEKLFSVTKSPPAG